MPDSGPQPVTVWGSNVSYFTGKLENYLRVKDIPYRFHSVRLPGDGVTMKKHLGVMQLPALVLADGRWMTDTSKIIEWFENQTAGPSIYPGDPLQRFVCLLIEDYADEWLWRPALHFRWHYAEGAHHLSRHLVDEIFGGVPLPKFIKRALLRLRQRQGYTSGDGITKQNVAGVEAIYYRTLEQLQAIFSTRPFVFGDRPTLADIGLSGPFFRHFGLDPIPLEIMRREAPAVWEWVARLWNTKLSEGGGENLITGIPDDLGPLLNEIGSAYLPYLGVNIDAIVAGKKRFDANIGGVAYRGARPSRYRVWCLRTLRNHYLALAETGMNATEQLLRQHHCWHPLWRHQQLPLEPGEEERMPFYANNQMFGVSQ